MDDVKMRDHVVEVDGAVIHVFPGNDQEVTAEQVRQEIRKAIRRVEAGDMKT